MPKTEREFQAWQTRFTPRVPFDVFLRSRLEWRRGEHFAMIGPTGQGKTNMMISVLPQHPFTVVFATKPHDDTMDALIESGGYMRMERWQSMPARDYPRRVLWPDATQLRSKAVQKDVFSDAFDRIYRERGWTVALDETWYQTNVLKLREDIVTYLTQSRSLEISLLCATQRPANVPVEMYDQSTHLMFWRDTDRRNLERIADINYGQTEMLMRTVANLQRYQVLYINTRTGQMLRTTAPLTAFSRQAAG